MANIDVNDLIVTSILDDEALAGIVGGMYKAPDYGYYWPSYYDVTSIHNDKYFNDTSYSYRNVTAYENNDFFKSVYKY